MKIKKTFQGSIPENKILNSHSTSQTDTYSCEKINEITKNLLNRRLKLGGKSEQATRSGKNLLKGLSTPTTDTDYWDSTTKTYFTPLKDGWGKFEYDNTSGISNVFINASPKISSTNIKPKTQYTIVTEIRNGNISENSQAFFAPTTNNTNSSSATNAIIDYININNGGIFKNLITTKTSFDNVLLAFQTYLRLPANTKGSLEVRMSLYEGNYDITNFEYEAYGASPSQKYPSEVRNIGDNINLFNKNGSYNYGNDNYKTSLNAKGQIVSTSNYSAKRSAGLLIENLKTNTNYTISGILVEANASANSNANVDVMGVNSNTSLKRNSFEASLVKPYNFAFTFNTGNNGSIWLSFNGVSSVSDTKEYTTIFDNIKLEEGSVATPYTEYNCGSIDYKVENVNKTESKAIHFPLSEGQLLHEGDYIDSVVIHQNRKTLILDGTENWTYSGNNWVHLDVPDIIANSSLINAYCNIAKEKSSSDAYTSSEFCFATTDSKKIAFKCIGYNDLASWKTYLATQYANGTPVTVEYELAEELITPLTEKQIEAHYELQKAKYVDKMELTCLNEIEPTLTDIEKSLEESLLDVEKLLAMLSLNS